MKDCGTCSRGLEKLPYEKGTLCINCYNRKRRKSRPQKEKIVRKTYRDSNPDKIKDIKLRSAFGIGIQEYNELLRVQHDVCAICRNPEKIFGKNKHKPRALAVDHCHKTGKIRGLLCGGCNKGIGNLKESIDIFVSAVDYLIRSKGATIEAA